MNLKSILSPSRKLTLQVTCLSILIGIGTVISPFVIRSVIDGFLISQDRGAILFALFIVATFEAVSFGADFIIRNKINDQVESTLIQLKKAVLDALLKKRIQPDVELFNRTWSVDIKRVVQHDMRQRWLRYKDIFLVALMSFVMMNLSAQAGFFIVLIGALQFGLAAWDSKRNRGDIYYIRQSEELEYQSLKSLLQQLPHFYDKDLVPQEVAKLQGLVEHSVNTQNVADRNRSFLWDLKTVTRGLLILGALAIAAFGGVDMSWAAGTFWALMMVIFRLANPLNSLAQWIFSERAVESSRQRVSNLLLHMSDDRFQPGIEFQQFKNTVGKVFIENSSSCIQVILQDDKIEFFKDIARQWSSRFLWGNVQILTTPIDKPNKNCTHCIYILNHEHLNDIKLQDLLSAAPNVCILTSVLLPEMLFNHNFFWNIRNEKFVDIKKDSFKVLPELMHVVRNQSHEWSEAFRDLKMYCKLGVSFELVIVKWDKTVSRSLALKHVREVDHIIMGPDGFAIILLIGSEGVGRLRVIERLNVALPIKCYEVNSKLFITSRENWRESLTDVENLLTQSILSSSYNVNKEVA